MSGVRSNYLIMPMGSPEIQDRGSIIRGMSESTSELKKQLRKSCREIRSSLGEENRQEASLKICRLIENWSIFQGSGVVLVYLPMRGEVNLLPLMEKCKEKTWLVPRIKQHGSMNLHPYDPQRLVRHPFGMLEPDASLPIIPANQVELVLTPGLAYDRQGWRLGYGGGFYDRFFSQQKGCLRAGITFQALLQTDLPHNEQDMPMQFLVSEGGIMELFPKTPG